MQLARKEVAEERLKARKELYDLHKQQFDLGIISEFRLYQVDTDVQLLKDLIFQLDAQIAIDKHALAALVGNVTCLCGENGELVVKPAAQFNTAFPLPATLPIDLLARRPDITVQKWLVEAACYDIKAAKADFFPRIDLLGWIGFQSIEINKLFRGDQLIALGQGFATLPLFLAGKLQAQLGVAQEELEIAIDSYNQTILNAVQQVSDALSNLTTADEREKSIKRAIKDTTDLLDLTRQKYENGISTKLTVLNAVEDLYIQKDLEVQIQLARFEAVVELIRAIGGGYHECCH
jgi:NodT family efflux transporter outer membrane factor (OMF) lipoprotein